MGDEIVQENGCSTPLDDEINDKIITSEKQEDSEKTFDEESDTRSNSIHIEVKVTDRKESSIDTEYDDYVKKFGGEDYLLDIKDSEDDINYRWVENSNVNTFSVIILSLNKNVTLINLLPFTFPFKYFNFLL